MAKRDFVMIEKFNLIFESHVSAVNQQGEVNCN